MRFDILGINILSTIIGGLAIYYFCFLNFNAQLSKYRILSFIISFSFLNGIIASVMMLSGPSVNTLKPFVLLVTSIIIIKLFIQIKWYHSFIVFFVFSVTFAIGNALSGVLIGLINSEFNPLTIMDHPWLLLATNILSNLFALGLIILTKPFRKTFLDIKKNQTMAFMMLATFIILAANFSLYYTQKGMKNSMTMLVLVLTSLYCVVFVLLGNLFIRKEIVKSDLEQQKFYNESLNSTLFNLRRFKHDWSNNLTVINSMLAMNKIIELKQYLSELINQSLEGGNTAIYSIKNAGLFGIISSKLNQARDMEVVVDFSVIGEVENIPGIKISELCEVIGIFIDNAIEEAVKGEKKISLSVFSDKDLLEISVSNSCTTAPDLKMINKEGYSSKGENRGMGLAIVKKIIGKYKNILHISDYEDNIFTQTITIEKGL